MKIGIKKIYWSQTKMAGMENYRAEKVEKDWIKVFIALR